MSFSFASVLYLGYEILDLQFGDNWVAYCCPIEEQFAGSIRYPAVMHEAFVQELRSYPSEASAEAPSPEYIAAVEAWTASTEVIERITREARNSPHAQEILDAVMLGREVDQRSVEALRAEAGAMVAEHLGYEGRLDIEPIKGAWM